MLATTRAPSWPLVFLLTLFCSGTPLHGQDFSATLTAASGQGLAYEMTFGFSPSATDGYDAGLDLYHPPPPPPPSFDAALGWGLPLDRYFTQILLGDSDWTLHRYQIQLQYDTNEPIKLSWDNSGWNDLMSSCVLQDPFGGSLLQVDLLADTQVTLTNTALALLYLDVTPKWYPWSDLGGALAGGAGEPVFTGAGLLVSGDVITLDLSNARPLALSYLVVGLTALNAPFKGGTLIPNPDLLIAPLFIGAAGDLSLAGPWPPGIPPGIVLYFQHWIIDDTGPNGFAASNGLSGTTGP